MPLAPHKKRTIAVAAALGSLWAARANADTWQVPIGAAPLANVVACGAIAGGWSSSAAGSAIEAPKDKTAVGQAVDARVAASAAECTSESAKAEVVTLIATGAAPTVDAASVTWFVDEGRLELRGHGLAGARLGVHHGSTWASDVCTAPTTDGDFDKCTFAIPRGFPADPEATQMQLFPAGSRAGDNVVTFDVHGRRLTDVDARIVPAKMILSRVEASDAALDLGAGRIALDHPEAVASAECPIAQARCDREDDGVHVRTSGAIPTQLTVKLHLAPHIFLAGANGAQLSDTTFAVPVLACPMRITSGPPIRSADDAKVAVEIDARCGDPRTLHFTANGRTADRVAQTTDGRNVLLSIGRLESDELVVLATRDGATVGQTRDKSRALPLPKATLELENGTPVDFVPTNRSARLLVADIEGALTYVPLAREGAYDVESTKGQMSIRGEPSAVGMVALRFAVRDPELPAPLGSQDLAIVTEPVERPLHEANVPVSLGSSAMGDDPVVELVCNQDGRDVRILPGVRTQIAYGSRDSCRIVFHRERVADIAGAQLLNLDIDVTKVDGTTRPEAHVSQTIVLRHATTPRLAWIKGVKGSFDSITIHLSHVIDETHYVGAAELRTGTPAVQWSVLAGKGVARLYGTTAIPTGLYRVSDAAHSGILALNFGALLRLTWLDSEGHEGFLGLEAGMMGVGLANDTSSSGKSLTQVATVTGAGLSVPIANRGDATETSINLHAWFEYEPSRAVGGAPGSPIGFVFGPSISIGNVGTNL